MTVEIATIEGHPKLAWAAMSRTYDPAAAIAYARSFSRPIQVGRFNYTPEVRVVDREGTVVFHVLGDEELVPYAGQLVDRTLQLAADITTGGAP